jgi:heme/copper-type cytochrome/quinol oxidase subunit 2
MGLGTSIFLIAVGAILKFAVDVQNENVDVETVGAILMVVGIIGAVLSMFFWSTWGGLGGGSSRRTTVIDDAGAVPVEPVYTDGPGRRVVREEVRRDSF